MGGWVSYAWWGGAPDQADPISGLSRRDIYHVRRSWAVVYANPIGSGTELLKRFFRAHPEARVYFRLLNNLPEEKFAENSQFKAHVVSLMGALDNAVKHLHQPELAAALMHKLGESHSRRRIQRKHFNDLKVVLVKMFVEVLQLDDATLESWGRTVDFLYKNIFEELEPSEKNHEER